MHRASVTQIGHSALLSQLPLSSSVIGLIALCEGVSLLLPGPFDVGVRRSGLDSFKRRHWGAWGTAGQQRTLVSSGGDTSL